MGMAMVNAASITAIRNIDSTTGLTFHVSLKNLFWA
jgi:hypothetical protein